MHEVHQTLWLAWLVAGGVACAGVAHAAPPEGPLATGFTPESADTSRMSGTAVVSSINAIGWNPVAPSQLDGLRGGDGAESNVLIDGLVDGNTADNIDSGDNLLGGGAFGHASGINTVIQNSGSNVLIQSGTAVSVQFSSPTP